MNNQMILFATVICSCWIISPENLWAQELQPPATHRMDRHALVQKVYSCFNKIDDTCCSKMSDDQLKAAALVSASGGVCTAVAIPAITGVASGCNPVAILIATLVGDVLGCCGETAGACFTGVFVSREDGSEHEGSSLLESVRKSDIEKFLNL